MPIYKAICTAPRTSDKPTETRLIDAPNTAAAMRYAAQGWLSIELLSVETALELGATGIKIEKSE